MANKKSSKKSAKSRAERVAAGLPPTIDHDGDRTLTFTLLQVPEPVVAFIKACSARVEVTGQVTKAIFTMRANAEGFFNALANAEHEEPCIAKFIEDMPLTVRFTSNDTRKMAKSTR